MINAIVDGTTYTGIEQITTGGKTINLQQIGGEGLPSGIGEVKINTFSPASDIYTSTDWAHGCTMTPDIIIIYSDFKTHYTESVKPNNTTIVAEHWSKPGGTTSYSAVPASYAGGTNPTTNVAGSLAVGGDGNITNVDATNVTINAKGTRRIGGGLTYTMIAIVLDSGE